MAEEESVITDRQTIEGGIILKIEGEVDLIHSPQFRIELMQVLDDGVDRLIIDLSGVPFMDSSGVATLVEALQVQRKKTSKLVLCNLQQKVRSIFDISRLDMVFTITDDIDSAILA